jgi:heme exporter protein C
MRKLFGPLVAVTGGMLVVSPFLIASAPYESTMLLIQKIFYYHVPSWFAMFAAVFAAGIGSARYLFKKDPAGDRLAVAGAELAVVFGAIGLVTGPLWARKAWGVAWQWDAKLTTALLLEVIFVAYLIVRKYGGPGSEKLAAALALFGVANVPFVYLSVHIWRTIHPLTTVVPSLQPGMREPFWFCVVAFWLLLATLMQARMELERRRTELDELYLAEEG